MPPPLSAPAPRAVGPRGGAVDAAAPPRALEGAAKSPFSLPKMGESDDGLHADASETKMNFRARVCAAAKLLQGNDLSIRCVVSCIVVRFLVYVYVYVCMYVCM